jgi:HEAT repeat protein
MRGSFALVLLLALVSGGFASAQPKVDLKKDPAVVVPDALKIGNKTLDQCIKEIGLKDVSRREGAIRYIALFPPDQAVKAIPALLAELRRLNTQAGDLSVRTSICVVVAEIFRTYNQIDVATQRLAAATFQGCLHDREAVMRFRGAQALGTVGPEAKGAINDLLGLLKDPATWEIRQAAAQALGMISYDKSGPNVNVLRSLYNELNDPAFQVRLAAIQSIMYLGPPSDQAGAASYIKLLESAYKTDSEVAIQIWARVGIAYAQSNFSAEMLGPIGKLMKDPDSIVRTQAIQAMGSLGAKGRSTLPDIIRCLGDADNMVKLTAIWAVGQMADASIMAIPVLQAIIADPKEDATTKLLAKQSLEKIKGGK